MGWPDVMMLTFGPIMLKKAARMGRRGSKVQTQPALVTSIGYLYCALPAVTAYVGPHTFGLVGRSADLQL